MFQNPRQLRRPALVCTAIFASLAPLFTQAAPLAAINTPVAPAVTAAVPAGKAAPTSAAEVMAQLDPNGSALVYLSTASWLAGLSQQLGEFRDVMIPPDASAADRETFARLYDLALEGIRRSGVEELTGVGFSWLNVNTELVRQKSFLHHNKGAGTGFGWALMGPPSHKLEAISILPSNTALASFSDIDPELLLDLISRAVEHTGKADWQQSFNQALATFSAGTGMPAEDAARSLVGTAGLIITLDPADKIKLPMGDVPLEIPRPGLALLLPAKDDRIFQQLEKIISAMPGATRSDTADLRLRVAPEVPVGPVLKIKPVVARWANYLVLATDEKLVRSLIDAKATGKGFTATPEFMKVSAGMPTEGSAFSVTTQLFTDTLAKVQMESMKDQANLSDQQRLMMTKLFSLNSGSSAFSVSAHLENGILITSQATRNPKAMKPAALLGALMTIGANSAHTQLKSNAEITKSLSQARQIGIACRMYATDHDGKFPAKLPDLVPKYLPDAISLRSPFNQQGPDGYTYTPGLTIKSPGDTVLAEDAYSVEEQEVRIIVQVDGAAKQIKTDK